ncbi:unnamed protein product [Toxocara canis]|uniref:60S ribosomal export protein NMD3 n=1 Tax=Toxocara canis TaxID=6265 RepID=A0A183UDF5_TOXCA|nr:unnamed protein product [Toxocara canis]
MFGYAEKKPGQLTSCKFCGRFLLPPNGWVHAQPESKELLSLALKKLKPTMTKVRLTDASFIWTEPHSKRIKVKLTIQKEVLSGAILQQTFVVEFVVQNQICDDCRRAEAKDFWRACVQVRQRCDFKKTLFYLEQLVLKHGAHINTTGVKPVATGIDFYYAKQQDARKLVDFILSVLPCKYHYAQELVTHDPKNNTYDYKHTFCVDVVPICKDNVICLPKRIAQSLGNMSQLVVCLRVSNVVTLIDPSTLQIADITATQYWRDPFEALCQSKQLVEFYVLDVEEVDDLKRSVGHGHVSTKHRLADAWVVRSNQVGESSAQTVCCRTHLGHLLKPGDLVLGFDIGNSNVNSRVLDEMKADKVADVILVRKVFDRTLRQRRRGFMEDLEEDEQMREKINIYKDRERIPPIDEDDTDVDLPPGPSLAEMLDDLDINTDVEMTGMDG